MYVSSNLHVEPRRSMLLASVHLGAFMNRNFALSDDRSEPLLDISWHGWSLQEIVCVWVRRWFTSALNQLVLCIQWFEVESIFLRSNRFCQDSGVTRIDRCFRSRVEVDLKGTWKLGILPERHPFPHVSLIPTTMCTHSTTYSHFRIHRADDDDHRHPVYRRTCSRHPEDRLVCS